jgi:hypothetical protein
MLAPDARLRNTTTVTDLQRRGKHCRLPFTISVHLFYSLKADR